MLKKLFLLYCLLCLSTSKFLSATTPISLAEIYSKDESTYCATWASSQYLTEQKNQPPVPLSNNSFRQIVHVSIGGELLRVKFSNRLGNGPLEIKAARIANSKGQGTGQIDMGTNTKLTFGGAESVTVPAGEDIYCDTFNYALTALSEVAITVTFGQVPSAITSHAGSRTFSFFGSGVDLETFPATNKIDHWYILTDIEVSTEPAKKCVICFGDSITDGRGTTNDKQDRWTDHLAFKLNQNKDTKEVAVVNEGIGATTVLKEGLERFDRDVVNVKGAKYVVMLYGVNDILFNNVNAQQLIQGYKTMIEKAHKAKMLIYGCTILPFCGGQYNNNALDKIRQEVNEWIKKTSVSEGGFDGYADFDDIMKDPSNPANLDKQYDSGDGLHPNPAGYQNMVNAFTDLTWFTK